MGSVNINFCCKFTISFGRLSFSVEIFRIQEILGTSLRLPFLHPWHTLTCLCRQDDCVFTLKAIEDLAGFNQWYRREQGQVHTYLLLPEGRQGQELWSKRQQKHEKKVKCVGQTNRPTDQRMDEAGYRVAYSMGNSTRLTAFIVELYLGSIEQSRKLARENLTLFDSI